MSELSVFIDESGDFGPYEHHAPLHHHPGLPRPDGVQDISRGEHVLERASRVPAVLRPHNRLLRQRPEGDNQPCEHPIQRLPGSGGQKGVTIRLQSVPGGGHVLHPHTSRGKAQKRRA